MSAGNKSEDVGETKIERVQSTTQVYNVLQILLGRDIVLLLFHLEFLNTKNDFF